MSEVSAQAWILAFGGRQIAAVGLHELVEVLSRPKLFHVPMAGARSHHNGQGDGYDCEDTAMSDALHGMEEGYRPAAGCVPPPVTTAGHRVKSACTIAGGLEMLQVEHPRVMRQ